MTKNTITNGCYYSSYCRCKEVTVSIKVTGLFESTVRQRRKPLAYAIKRKAAALLPILQSALANENDPEVSLAKVIPDQIRHAIAKTFIDLKILSIGVSIRIIP